MLENPSADSRAAAASIVTVKRYAPHNQRSRSLGRRKSGGGSDINFNQRRLQSQRKPSTDRLERANSYVYDGYKNPLGATKTGPIADHVDSTYNNRSIEIGRAKIIHLHGCCNSEAAQLLSNRWTAAMNAYNSLPEDSAGKRKKGQSCTPGRMRQPGVKHFFHTS